MAELVRICRRSSGPQINSVRSRVVEVVDELLPVVVVVEVPVPVLVVSVVEVVACWKGGWALLSPCVVCAGRGCGFLFISLPSPLPRFQL